MTENSWKNLIDNPKDWWDYISMKPNEKYSDFEHKQTDETLRHSTWSTPEWVSSKLPPAETASYAEAFGGHIDSNVMILYSKLYALFVNVVRVVNVL
ncbi:hypothetical protein ZIOFF_068324 [Zingiber officinale]|uniref:Uncharacterized protein n=1 Tax=Zingiber officinale TaxID=94328 RepID=A0A8J5CH49_ZINOF|nr:hypothetical protein ZIOFF_068324 [Zingiber officinale]